MPQRRRDVGDDRWAFEAAERANRDADRLTVAAAGAGLNDGEIAGRRGATVFRLEDGQPRRVGLRMRRKYMTAENAKHAENPFLCDRRG
jgi:hypothetical protein